MYIRSGSSATRASVAGGAWASRPRPRCAQVECRRRRLGVQQTTSLSPILAMLSIDAESVAGTASSCSVVDRQDLVDLVASMPAVVVAGLDDDDVAGGLVLHRQAPRWAARSQTGMILPRSEMTPRIQ